MNTVPEKGAFLFSEGLVSEKEKAFFCRNSAAGGFYWFLRVTATFLGIFRQ